MGAGAGTGQALPWAIASDVPSTSPGHRTNSGAHGEAYSMHMYAFKQSCAHDSCNKPGGCRSPFRLTQVSLSAHKWFPFLLYEKTIISHVSDAGLPDVRDAGLPFHTRRSPFHTPFHTMHVHPHAPLPREIHEKITTSPFKHSAGPAPAAKRTRRAPQK